MSIEGMWCFVSGEVGTIEMTSGGVLILDTQRLYGGDSAMAYVGRYDLQDGRVVGEVETFRYNPAAEGVDVFGEPMGPPRRSVFDVRPTDDGFLVGSLTRGEISLPVVLQKLRNLP